MKTIKHQLAGEDVMFKQRAPDLMNYNALLKINEKLSLSVGFGEHLYAGQDITSDLFEIAVIDNDTNEFIQVPGELDTVIGWQNEKDITKLINKLRVFMK